MRVVATDHPCDWTARTAGLGGVIALVLMHIATAAIAVVGFRRVVPVR